MSVRPHATFVLALAAPVVVAACFVLVVEATEWSGRDWWSDTRPRNAAEAAAAGRAADLVRQIRRGEHPEQIVSVRAETVPEAPAWLSPLEGAMWADGPAMIRLLEREGAVLTEAMRRRLACLAEDLGRRPTADYLRLPSGAACDPGEALASVRARTGPF